MKINELKQAEYNPRAITEKDLKALEISLLSFGDLGGIIYNRSSGNLVGGHQRVNVLRGLNSDLDIIIEEIFETPSKQGTVARGYFMERIYRKFLELGTRTTPLNILLPFRIGNKMTNVKEKRFICNGDNNQIIYILADGTVIPCDKLPTDIFENGNLKFQRLSEIWTSDKMKAFKLMSPRKLGKCSTCSYLRICGGACVARAFHSGGSLDSLDLTSCLITKKIVQNL